MPKRQPVAGRQHRPQPIGEVALPRDAGTLPAAARGPYRGLLEAAPDAMIVVNGGGLIVLLNRQAERQFGYPRIDLVGQPVESIVPGGFADPTLASPAPIGHAGEIHQPVSRVERLARRRDGSEFPAEIMLSSLEGPDGVLTTAAIRDITNRRQAETELLRKMGELVRSNHDLEQFAYVASHDLQEPLRMVSSYTKLLARRYTGKLDSNADEFIAFAMDGADRMLRVIKHLLAYSRVGTQGGELVAVSAESALRQAVVNLRGSIENNGAIVTHDPLPTIFADEIQLIQVFQNLIGNAIKYRSAEPPRVHVSAARNADVQWIFSVRDNGTGIDARDFARIFGMFARGHDHASSPGTGIGLAICKKIVERHGGAVWVESEPGKGATFRFSLSGREDRS